MTLREWFKKAKKEAKERELLDCEIDVEPMVGFRQRSERVAFFHLIKPDWDDGYRCYEIGYLEAFEGEEPKVIVRRL